MYKVGIEGVDSHRNVQVKFEFAYGLVIFDRVIPLEFRKKIKFSLSVHYLCNRSTYLIQNLTDVWVHRRIMQVRFEFAYGLLIFDRVIPLELRKKI
jgi:hypothetical protein